MAASEGRHWWFVGRRSIIETVIRERLRPQRGARILEAGCGTGGNLALLRQFGELEAFEYDADARQIASARSGLDVMPGHLPDGISGIGGTFDIVGLFDVLEHLDDDEGSLRALARLLSPDGKIVLTVPALPKLWSSHDEVHHHHRRYSRKALLDVLSKAELHVEYVTYFNFLLLPAAIIQRLASRFSSRSGNLDSAPSEPVNSILAAVFGAERIWLRRSRLPIGLSLLAICTLP